MTGTKQSKKRRPFYLIINKEFQYSFTYYFVMLMLLSVGFVWATVYLVFQMHIARASEDMALLEAIKSTAANANFFFFWEGILVLALSALLALVVSRRIAGPLYRIEQELKSFNSEEKVKEIRIRKNDYFQGLVDELNSVFDKLKK